MKIIPLKDHFLHCSPVAKYPLENLEDGDMTAHELLFLTAIITCNEHTKITDNSSIII